MTLTIPARLVRWVLGGSVIGLAAVVCHQFFGHIGAAPALGVDELLANVSFSLAEHGRYGLPASPVQTNTDLLRLRGFFNYGPWYFGLGAAGVWLFDDVLIVHRALHLLGIALACLAAFTSYRRRPLAWGGFVVLMAHLFRVAEWPMARPDIVGAVFGVWAVAATTRAMRTDDAPFHRWAVAGFMVGAAVTSHPVFWALTAAIAGALMLWTITRQRPEHLWRLPDKTDLGAMLGVISGGGVALLVFLIAIDFRLGDFLTFVGAYGGGAGGRPFVDVLGTRWLGAWGMVAGANGFSLALGGAVTLAGGTFLAALAGRWRMVDRDCLAVVAPPLLFWVCYDFSLGIYPKYHQGYAIFSHMAAAWTAAAGVAVVGGAVSDRSRTWAMVMAAVMVATVAVNAYRFPPLWSHAAGRSVDIASYGSWVLDGLPKGARVVGAAPFAQRSGGRIDIVGLADALALFERIPEEKRAAAAPSHLILSHYESSVAAWQLLVQAAGQGTDRILPWRLMDMLPEGGKATLLGRVWGPPYGLARIYQMGGDPRVEPWLMASTGASPQWRSELGPGLATGSAAARTHLHLSWNGQRLDAVSDTAVHLDAPAGLLAIRLTRNDVTTRGGGVFIAAPAVDFTTGWDEFGSLPLVVYFGFERETEMIIDHAGGPLWISQFDANGTNGFTVTEVRPIIAPIGGVESPNRDAPEQPPPLARWLPTRLAQVQPSARALALSAMVPGWGHLLESPLFQVTGGSVYQIHIPVEKLDGDIAIGVLDEARRWVLPPTAPWRNLRFAVDGTRRVRIVVTSDTVDRTARAVLGEPRLQLLVDAAAPLYVDRLTSCYRGLPRHDYAACEPSFVEAYLTGRTP